jgi:hypothetical protein
MRIRSFFVTIASTDMQRARLIDHGTKVNLNDEDDVTGDGDQLEILLDHDGKQVYCNLFATG